MLYVTIEEAAEYLELHPIHIWDLLRRGEIDGVWTGEKWLVLRESLDRWNWGWGE